LEAPLAGPSLLSKGDPGIEAVAAELKMSARSLRRRLQDEGTNYRRTLDELRSALAKQQLRDEGRSVEEVAYALGFSDASAFHKAFRRWTGSSPAEYAKSGAR
jgi:AraC-like DNA-binding protein